MDAKVCKKGEVNINGKCMVVHVGVTAEDRKAIENVLEYVGNNKGKNFSEELKKFSSEGYAHGYDAGHHDALKQIQRVLDENGFYIDI